MSTVYEVRCHETGDGSDYLIRAVFGQMKYNMQYKRFRHFGKDKVTMDFAFFAIAFDIKKMAAKRREMPNKQHRKDILEPIYRIDAAKCRRISITGRLFTKKTA